MVKTGTGTSFSCDCPSGQVFFLYSGSTNKCYETTCDPRCNGMCIVASGDNTQCTGNGCASGMTKTGTGESFTCDCPSGATWESSLCLYTTGCSPNCALKCTVVSSTSSCYSDCAAGITKSGTGPLYTCECPSGTTYYPSISTCIFTSSCSDKCGSSLCSVQSSDLACYGSCADPNIVPTLISPSIYSCVCPSPSTWDPTQRLCAYSAGCDIRCPGTCWIQNSNLKCKDGCGSGMTTVSFITPDYKCDCPGPTKVYESSIPACVFAVSCDQMCNFSHYIL